MSEDTMKENCHVLVRKIDGGYSRLMELVPKRAIMIEKLRFFADKAVGLPYGTLFEVKDSQLEVVSPDDVLDADDDLHPADLEAGVEQSSQSLSYENIVALKARGSSGERIVSHLVEGSKTFKRKHAFAQEKYLKRKRRKHGNQVVLSRPTLRLLCGVYYGKDTEKACSLRIDLLAQLFTLANVHWASKILVIEQTQGMVTAGLLERMAGGERAMCIHMHKGDQAQGIPCVDAMDFDQKVMDCFYPVPISEWFGTAEADKNLTTVCEADSPTPKSESESNSKIETEDSNETNTNGEPVFEISEERRLKQRLKRDKRDKAERVLRDGLVEGVIVATRSIDLVPILKTLLMQKKAVMASSPLVLYSPHLEPLLRCYKLLRDENLAINVKLTDSFFRLLQVLPDRTHPEMTQLVAGGFILSAVTVCHTD